MLLPLHAQAQACACAAAAAAAEGGGGRGANCNVDAKVWCFDGWGGEGDGVAHESAWGGKVCRGDVNHENNNCNHHDNNGDNNDDNNDDNNGDTNDDQMEGIAPAGKRTKNCLVWPLSIVAL